MTVSVIIINWNSRDFLLKCIGCLERQTIQPYQVIIIDNGSHDDSLAELKTLQHSINIEVKPLNVNHGFASANNIGVRLTQGKWLALLNADAFPESKWLQNLLQAAEQNPEYSFFSSRQLQANNPDILDGTGDNYHISGLAWRRHYNFSSNKFGLQADEVFSACGAAALFLRDDFLQAGGFDEDYFSYFEDVDLGFRLRLAGKKCLYVPDAVVQHVGSASTGKRSDFSVYYGYRNMIWTFLKNMPSPLLFFFLPIHIGIVLFFILYLTFRGQGKVILRAVMDAVRGLPNILAKRKEIQRNIKINPFELLRVMSTGLLKPYQEFFQRNKRK